jgi:putative phosphoribosyl transferase
MSKLIEDSSLRDRVHVYKDRREAGLLLSKTLADYKGENGMVLGVPSGGVPVAGEIAGTLGLELDLIIVRKIQMPHNTEAGFGAVGPDGDVSVNTDLVGRLGLTQAEVDGQIEKTREIIKSRNSLFRRGLPFPSLGGKFVIIVDDGLASGYTMLSAIDFVKHRRPGKIIVAVPTAPQRTVDLVLPRVDELICPNIRAGVFFAVADAYENWYDLDDKEVISILERFRRAG